MGHAGVDGVDGEGRAVQREALVQPHPLRFAHREADVVADELCGDHSGDGFKTELAGDAREPSRKPGEAARAVAAHLGFAAVGIVVAHPKIRAVLGGFDRQEPVGPHAAMPVAKVRTDLAA